MHNILAEKPMFLVEQKHTPTMFYDLLQTNSSYNM